MQSHVKVKILREMRLNDRGIEREPVGWFRFDEAYQYNTLPEIFVRFVQQHLSRKECCKNFSSQIVIIFKDEEKEHEKIDPEISDWINTVCSMEPGEGELKNIYFPRLWREYKKQMGHCFSCGEDIDYIGPCLYCKIDFIVLEEMTHFANAWTNWGNSVFISNSMPTITSRGEINAKFQSEIYTRCMAIFSPLHLVNKRVNPWNIYREERRIREPSNQPCYLRTWNNLTAPLNYAAAARIRECGNRKSTTIPMLEELCLKKIFSILEEKRIKENKGLSPQEYTQLPLPPTMISEMMNIFSCAEYLTFVRNPERDCVPRIRIQMSGQHALGDCKLQ